MLSKINSSTLNGIDAIPIIVEINVSRGMGYQITGLADEAIKESLSRIAIAINSNGFSMPRTKLVINLGPADLRKSGTAFDLPIAIGILLASEQLVDFDKLNNYVLVGELGLDGTIYPVRGALCMTYFAKQYGYKGIILPNANASDAALVDGIDVFAVSHLNDVIEFILSDLALTPFRPSRKIVETDPTAVFDFIDVKGQKHVKRALEIAAAGGHNTLVIGPPGIGKTMLAKRLPSILPPMTIAEALETTRIYSIRNNTMPLAGLITERPFRNPHHTSSDVALAGGGSVPMPGEISLAHNGVLFLDELPEFRRGAIEVLRQPLEERKVFIARARSSIELPASFMLLAAMNPCLCGYANYPTLGKCRCSKTAMYWYRRKISGPLMERIDLHVKAEVVSQFELLEPNPDGESSKAIRNRVIAARNIQSKRFKDIRIHCNAQMPDNSIHNFCVLDNSARKLLLNKIKHLQLSARTYSRILKVSRTIADLSASTLIELNHIAEAIHYRALYDPLYENGDAS